MKRSKPQDRLSELPDSIIFDIFWLLPVTDVVRTTVLSKRWKNLSSTTPFLNFSDDKGSFCSVLDQYSEKVRNFVNRVLLRWDGARILKFKVDWSRDLERKIYGDIDLWLRFAKRNEVEELYLNLRHGNFVYHDDIEFDFEGEVYCVPQFLYSCSSFEVLSFKSCNFRIHGNVEWNNLKQLTIEGFEITGLVIRKILCGSPLLEILIFSFKEIGENYSFESIRLKQLSVHKYLHDQDYLSMDTELRIWAPNLELLEIIGLPFGKCLLQNISSLARVTLEMYGMHYYKEAAPGDDDICLFSTYNFLGDMFSPIIQHVKNISLSCCCIKVLGAMKERCVVSSFRNVKSLAIGSRVNDYKLLVVCLLDVFPQLKRLVLLDVELPYDEQESLDFDIKNYLNCEANLPKSFQLELRTVELTCLKDDNIYPFVEFLLKYATKLEKMVYQVRESLPDGLTNDLFLVSQKLLKMPRSSPTAELIFCRV